MFAITRQVPYSYLDPYTLELVYIAIFMIGMGVAMMLGRWTTKRLLIFVFIVAALLATAKASWAVLERTSGYSVQVPY